MRDVDTEQDDDKRVRKLVKAAYALGRKDMRAEIASEWQKMAVYIAWSTCKSLNIYDKLRMMVMYEARKPFFYIDSQSGESVNVDPNRCSRLLSASLRDTYAPIFSWKREFLRNESNRQSVERAASSWIEIIGAYLDEHFLPKPTAIVFVPETGSHARGNSFLLVFETPQDAASIRTKLVDIQNQPLKIVYVVIRRVKKRYSHGETAPNFLPVVSDIQAQARALSDFVRGFYIDHVSPPEYLCARGQRVLAERSVRLVGMNPSLSKEDITDWFVAKGLKPTKVLKDNEIKNAGGVSSRNVCWIVEFADSEINAETIDFSKVETALAFQGCSFLMTPLPEQVLVIQRVRKKSPGGRFLAPRLWGEKVLGDMAAMGKLHPTPGGSARASAVEFYDATPVAGHSAAFDRLRIVSDVIDGSITKFERVFEAFGSETKVFSAEVFLTPQERLRLEEDLGERLPDHLTVGDMRLVFARYLRVVGLVYTHPDGQRTHLKVEVNFVTGDAKGLDGYLAIDTLCPCCTVEYASLDVTPYDGLQRSSLFHKECWERFLANMASVIALAHCSEDFCKLLPKIETVEHLTPHLESAKTLLFVIEQELPLTEMSSEQMTLNPEFSSIFCPEFLDLVRQRLPNMACALEGTTSVLLSNLQGVIDNLDGLPNGVRTFLVQLPLSDQQELLVGLSTGVSLESLQACKSIASFREYSSKAKSVCSIGVKLSSKLPELLGAFAGLDAKEKLLECLGDESAGFGWRERSQSWVDACNQHTNPIFKTRFAKLLTLCKRICYHVVGLPMEFRGASPSFPARAKLPEPVPVIMHACGTMGKCVLGTVQRSEIGQMVEDEDESEGMLEGRGGAQELVHRYKALINTDITVKDAEKEGSHIGLAHNVTKIRRLVNRREELFANLIDRRGMMPLLTLEVSFSIIYRSQPPTNRLRCTLYVVNNLTFIMTSYLDASVRSQEKKLRKPKMRAIHPHLFISHIPDFYNKNDLPLPVVSEEDGESSHRQVKTDAKRSDNNLNVIDTTRTSELIHDIVLRDFLSSNKQNLVGRKRNDSSFRPTVIPHFAIFCCVFSLTALSCRLFFQMLCILHVNKLASGFVFVFESEEARKEREFPHLRKRFESCSCRCWCNCKSCKSKCVCKCNDKCPCQIPSEFCRCFREPIFFVLSGDGFPERGDKEFHLRDAPLLGNQVAPISWCEQFAEERGSCRDGAGNFTVHCSATKVRGADLLPLGEYLRLRSISVFRRYRLRYRLRQLLAAARLSRDALSKGFSVTRFQPAVARPEGGATITIFGRGFATPFRGLVFEVAIDDQACRRVQVESDGELTCTAPPGSGVRLKVTVTPIVQVSYGGGQSPLTYDMKLAPLTLSGFAYTGPTVDRVHPAELPTVGGTLTLYGRSLGSGAVAVAASDHVKCQLLSSRSDQLVVSVGPGTGSRKTITVRNSAGISKAHFSYAAPMITAIDTNGLPHFSTCPKNETFIIQGRNFGSHLTTDRLKVSVGGCNASANLGREHEELHVYVPLGAGGQAPVQVTLDGLSSVISSDHSISYFPPHVISCTKSGVPAGHFVVSGRYFGTGVNTTMSISIGGKSCSEVNLIGPHHKIEATISDGSGTNLPIVVKIGGVVASADAGCTFSYQGFVSRAGPAISDSMEVVDIFCQAQLARYYKNGIRQAETDMHGRPFTKESAQKATEAWNELEPKIRRM